MIAVIDGNLIGAFVFGSFILMCGLGMCLGLFFDHRESMKKLELEIIKETKKEKVKLASPPSEEAW